MLQWTLGCMYLSEFSLDTCPGVGLLDRMIVLFLICKRNLHTFLPSGWTSLCSHQPWECLWLHCNMGKKQSLCYCEGILYGFIHDRLLLCFRGAEENWVMLSNCSSVLYFIHVCVCMYTCMSLFVCFVWSAELLNLSVRERAEL